MAILRYIKFHGLAGVGGDSAVRHSVVLHVVRPDAVVLGEGHVRICTHERNASRAPVCTVVVDLVLLAPGPDDPHCACCDGPVLGVARCKRT
eukprot:3203216-Prymnesium_polylepis.1